MACEQKATSSWSFEKTLHFADNKARILVARNGEMPPLPQTISLPQGYAL